MALGDGTTWDETEPTDNTVAVNIDDYNRDLRAGIRSRMALEHEFPESQSATSEGGRHKYISFQDQASLPTAAISGTQVGGLYVKTQGLFFVNTASNEIQIVSGTAVGDGKVLIDATDTAAGYLADDVAGIESSGTGKGRVKMIGSWNTKSIDTTYTATYAGFLVLSITARAADNKGIMMDMQSPAGTSRSKIGHHSYEFGDTDIRHQGMIPVASGATYTIISSGAQNYTVESCYFVDIGA